MYPSHFSTTANSPSCANDRSEITADSAQGSPDVLDTRRSDMRLTLGRVRQAQRDFYDQWVPGTPPASRNNAAMARSGAASNTDDLAAPPSDIRTIAVAFDALCQWVQDEKCRASSALSSCAQAGQALSDAMARAGLARTFDLSLFCRTTGLMSLTSHDPRLLMGTIEAFKYDCSSCTPMLSAASLIVSGVPPHIARLRPRPLDIGISPIEVVSRFHRFAMSGGDQPSLSPVDPASGRSFGQRDNAAIAATLGRLEQVARR